MNSIAAEERLAIDVPSQGLSRLVIPFALMMSIALLLVLQTLYWPYIVDDVYISLTYARNLGDGLGLVHNQGLRVEGYSNFLWVLLMAPFRMAGLELLTVAKTLGIALSVGTLVLVPHLISRLVPDQATRKIASVSALALLAISPSFALWGVSGLETPLYTFLVVLGFSVLLDDLGNTRRVPSSAWVFGALALTRPEGFVFLLAVVLWLILWRWLGRGTDRPAIVWIGRWGLGVLLPIVLVTFFRVLYYGQLLPNTVYTKAGGDLIRQALRGMQYLYRFSSFSGYAVLIVGLLLGMRRALQDFRFGLIVAGSVAYLAFIVASGGDWMPHFRFFVPILPFLIIMSVTESAGFIHALAISGRWVSGLAVFASGVAFLLVLGAMATFYSLRVEGIGLGYAGAPVGWLEYVRAHGRVEDTIAVVDAGRVGYETELQVLDMVGLLDQHIAHLDPILPDNPLEPAVGYLYGKWDTDYILDREPAFVQVHLDMSEYLETGQTSTDWLGTDDLLNDPRFRHLYVLENVDRGPVFVRRDVLDR